MAARLPFPDAAAEHVVVECPAFLEKSFEAHDDIVLHDSVAEIGGYHLAQTWFRNDKCYGLPRDVFAVEYLAGERNKLAFFIEPKAYRVSGMRFVF